LPVTYLFTIFLFMQLLEIKAFKAIVLVIVAGFIAFLLDLFGFDVLAIISPLVGTLVATWLRYEVKYFED
jgi:hypothetical protein